MNTKFLTISDNVNVTLMLLDMCQIILHHRAQLYVWLQKFRWRIVLFYQLDTETVK